MKIKTTCRVSQINHLNLCLMTLTDNEYPFSACNKITIRANLCLWLMDHGRCGEDFPTAHNQYFFIRDNVVTAANSKTEKDECNSKPPSPKDNVSNIIDYYGYDYD